MPKPSTSVSLPAGPPSRTGVGEVNEQVRQEGQARLRLGPLEWIFSVAVVQNVVYNPILTDAGPLQIYASGLMWTVVGVGAGIRWARGGDSHLSETLSSLIMATVALCWLVMLQLLIIGFQKYSLDNLVRLLFVPLTAVSALAVYRCIDKLLDITVVALAAKGLLLILEMAQGPIDLVHRMSPLDLGAHNAFGAFTAFLVILRLSTWILGGRRPGPLVMSALGVCGVCIVLTFSRSAYVAMLVSLAALGATALQRAGKKRRVLVPAVLLIAVISVPFVAGEEFQTRFVSVGPGQNSSSILAKSSGRGQIWLAALEGFARRPITGNGFGSFEFYGLGLSQDVQAVNQFSF